MDFDEAVNQALGPPTEPKPEKEKADKPKKVKVPREEKKRKERDETEERPKKKKTLLPEELEAQKELFAQLVRYCEAFPECAHGLFVHPEAPCEEIEFQLATIQRRINAKNELGMMRAGLVTGCMLMETGNDLMGSPLLLRGFAISVQAAGEQFDSVLKQILCKYGGNFAMSCEATLGLLLLKHAATTHMANSAEALAKKEANKDVPKIKEERVDPPTIIEIDSTEPEPLPTPDSTSLPQ
jgi:hypothetical protein